MSAVTDVALEAEPQLHRTLSLRDVALFFVVAGSNLQWIATAAGAGPSSLVIWVGGCFAMFVPLSIAVVHLSSHYPEEGGLYIWSKRAFGPFAGFLTGWMYWTANLPYFPALLYFAAGNALFVTGNSGGALATSAPFFIAAALLGLAVGTYVNVLGLGVGKWLNTAGAVCRWSITIILIVLGAAVWIKFGSATTFSAATLRPGIHLKDVIFWSVIAFAWTGPEAVSFMGGEVREPRRSIPLGLALAAPAIAIIYILGTASALVVLTPNAISASSGVMQTVSRAANLFGWQFLTPLGAILVAVSCMGSVGAWLGACARIPFVVGIDRYLPAALGRIHPRYGSPATALVCQALIAAVFVFLGQGGTSVKGAYEVMVSTTVIVTLLPFLFLFAAAFRFSGARPSAGMIRIPGGRYTVSAAAIAGAFTTLSAIVLATVPADDEPNKLLAVAKVLGATLVMAGSGVAVYVYAGRHERRARRAA